MNVSVNIPAGVDRIIYIIILALGLIGTIIAWVGLNACKVEGVANFFVTFGGFIVVAFCVIRITGFGGALAGMFLLLAVATVAPVTAITNENINPVLQCQKDLGAGTTMLSIALYLIIIVPYIFGHGIGLNGAGGVSGSSSGGESTPA